MMKQSRLLKSLLISVTLVGNLSCTGENPFKDLASNRNSDQALFEDAQKLLDSRNYTAAIEKILATTPAFQAQSRVKDSLAGAYAARCGMEFLTFVTNLTGGSSQSFYKLAMNGFVQVDTSNFADCVQARDIVKSVGNVGQRSASENLFLAILGMAMLGNRVRANADKLPTTLGDGNVDAGFNCGPTKFPIASAAATIEAFALILENLAGVAAIAGGTANQLSNLAASCGASCTTITYAGATPAESDAAIIAARALMNMRDIGLGACTDPNPINCGCASP
jgi:hypothetical protein